MSIQHSTSLPNHSPSDHAIEQEIRQQRTFSIAAAIGKEARDCLKGESPVPKLLQVKTELRRFVNQHLHDPDGALQATLQDLIRTDDAVCSRHFQAPLNALPELLIPFLTQETALQAFVQQVDMRWGQMYGEPPHFEIPGQPPHPDDEYTFASVRHQLTNLVQMAQLEQAARAALTGYG